nr:hypothetical protein [uncultured Rhodopila sp.]
MMNVFLMDNPDVELVGDALIAAQALPERIGTKANVSKLSLSGKEALISAVEAEIDFVSDNHRADISASTETYDAYDHTIAELVEITLLNVAMLAQLATEKKLSVEENIGTVVRFEVLGGVGHGVNNFSIQVKGVVEGRRTSFVANLTLPITTKVRLNDAQKAVLTAIIASVRPFSKQSANEKVDSKLPT